MYTHVHVYAGQSARVVVIAAGSADGCLVLLTMVVVIIPIALCFMLQKCKQKAYSLSSNVAYNRRRIEESSQLHDYDVITNDIASQSPASIAVDSELDVIYDTVCESNADAPQTSGEDLTTLTTEHNIAYKSSAVPMSLCVPHTESQQGPKTNSDYEYDYI